MISRLRGMPAGRTREGLILDVGGVGYVIAATQSALRKAEGARENAAGEVVIDTFLHVREDTLQLYGFGDASERELFLSLLGVSGIGPKVALGIVSSGSPADLRNAIVAGDTARFQAIPGIGKKTAERIVPSQALDLRRDRGWSSGRNDRARRARRPRRARIHGRGGRTSARRCRSQPARRRAHSTCPEDRGMSVARALGESGP
jgi:Holliday junction DNA helicase RuvA